MKSIARLKKTVLLFGDVFVLYLALLFTLIVRYGALDRKTVDSHLGPFSILFLFWILVFYIGGLYDFKMLRRGSAFAKQASILLGVNSVFAVLLFYFLPSLRITPRLNLFLFIALYGFLGFLWRDFVNHLLSSGLPKKKILLVGTNETARELAEYLERNPQLGYRISFWMKEGLRDPEFSHLSQILLAEKIGTIVLPAHIKRDTRAARLIYKQLLFGIEVMDLATLYEIVFQKVPLAELEEGWFLENIAKSHRLYEALKRPTEVMLGIILCLFLLPLAVVIALCIRATSRGSVLFTQRRIGRGGAPFTIYKFRTMRKDAEERGPQWARPHDPRNTPVGRFLRRTHLDELPQLWNMLRGELSFIGPRPERPEFVSLIEKTVPFYELRNLIRPGVSGWAQVNFRYGASVGEAYEKLQYDMYYLKNRSVVLDGLIVLRTIRFFFTNIS